MFRLLILVAVALLVAIGDVHAAALTRDTAAHGWVFDPHYQLGLGALGATLGTGVLTLADWAKRLDPNGKTPKIVEMLAQTNEILKDMAFVEGNLPTGTRVTIRTGLPTVYWRLLNQGIASSKSTTAQVDEQAGMLEAWSEVDKDLLLLNGNSSSFRMSEAKAFIEAMNQEMASTLIYGNAGLATEEFTGFAVRYSTISGAANADNIVDAGGTGSDNTSIWLVQWGEDTVHGVFPQGSKAGLIHEDFGELTITVTAGVGGTRMRGFQERYQWKAGLVVKDWRSVVRICNIDSSDLAGGSPADLIDAMEAADEIIPNDMGNRAFYCNRRVRRYLRKQVRADVSAGGGLSWETVAGKKVLFFGDTPIRRVDAILNTEARVV